MSHPLVGEVHPDSNGAVCHKCPVGETAVPTRPAGHLQAGDGLTTGISTLGLSHGAKGLLEPPPGQPATEQKSAALTNAARHADNHRAKHEKESVAPEAVFAATKTPCGNDVIDAHVENRWTAKLPTGFPQSLGKAFGFTTITWITAAQLSTLPQGLLLLILRILKEKEPPNRGQMS
jgi:hypothetical protein